MNSYKGIHAQAKFLKATCSSACGWGGHVKFSGTNKHCSYSKELITLVTSAVAKATKLTKKNKAESKDASDSEDDVEKLKFQKNDIGVDSDSEK